MPMKEDALKLHKDKKGKIEVKSKISFKNKEDLSLAYTPGVAEVSREIARDNEKIWDYTIKQNSVAIITDGTAVLGLGDIGPEAALPVMEGKAALLKEFANIDAFPICLSTKDEKEIIEIVKKISTVFGGVNLEDISAPRCFHIEDKLQNIGIPVFHDDQHGTAIVILAGLINASNVVGKKLEDLKIVISGAGAAGTAVTKLLLCLGYDKKLCTSVKEIILVDSKGIVYDGRGDETHHKNELAKVTNIRKRMGKIEDAIKEADVFIGVSRGNVLSKNLIKSMADDPIIFAMANPVPEIMPKDALDAGAKIMATGRSDFPNQVNNVLAFPGVFRGALDVRATKITNEMKLAAAYTLAKCIDKPGVEKILPHVFDKHVVPEIAKAVSKSAVECGVSRNA
jgi:malate dehydrogenase (oxaloacetate-decarboxylating)